MSAAELLKVLPGQSQKEFVSVTGTKVASSGMQEITTETTNGVKGSSYVSSEYYLLLVGDRILIVKSKVEPTTHISGSVKPVPNGLESSIFPDPSDKDLKDRLYSFMLSTTESYRLPGFIALALTLVYVVLVWIFAGRAWRHIQNISLHPVVKRVENWPNSTEVVFNAERELHSAIRYKKSGITLTSNFVIARRLFSFNLFPISDLVWAYQKVTTRMLYFVIPVSRSREAVLVFYGGSVRIPAGKKLVEGIIGSVAQSAPWAVFGYTEELARVFKDDPNGFAAAVEQRRLTVGK